MQTVIERADVRAALHYKATLVGHTQPVYEQPSRRGYLQVCPELLEECVREPAPPVVRPGECSEAALSLFTSAAEQPVRCLMDPQITQRVRQIEMDAYLRLLRVVAAQPLTWVRYHTKACTAQDSASHGRIASCLTAVRLQQRAQQAGMHTGKRRAAIQDAAAFEHQQFRTFTNAQGLSST